MIGGSQTRLREGMTSGGSVEASARRSQHASTIPHPTRLFLLYSPDFPPINDFRTIPRSRSRRRPALSYPARLLFPEP